MVIIQIIRSFRQQSKYLCSSSDVLVFCVSVLLLLKLFLPRTYKIRLPSSTVHNCCGVVIILFKFCSLNTIPWYRVHAASVKTYLPNDSSSSVCAKSNR